MTDLLLDIEIINSEQRNVSSTRKTILFSLLSGVWLLLLSSQPTKENSIYDRLDIWKGYPLILFVVLLISSGYMLMYIFYMVPSKGKISLNQKGLIITQNNKKELISLTEIEKVNFYIYKENEETQVYIELFSDRINLSNEINVAFMSERRILMNLVALWKEKDVNTEIITTPPNKKYSASRR